MQKSVLPIREARRGRGQMRRRVGEYEDFYLRW